MPGHTKAWTACTMWLIVLLSIGSVVAQQQAAAAQTAATAAALPAEAPLATSPLSSTPAAASQGSAQCRVNIRGAPSGTISAASMACFGGTAAVRVAADKVLNGFKPRFQGVVWDDRCGMPGCLLTFCGSTNVVIMDSSIAGIKSRHVDAVVCVADATSLMLRNTNVSYNNATALLAEGQSRVVVAASRIAYNVGNKYNGGVSALGDATLNIIDQSEVVGNVAANVSGGGVRVRGFARVTITGQSQILNNTSVAWSGGGVAAFDDAKLIVGGGSSICYNTGNGAGGLLATDRAHVVVRGASSVSFNHAMDGTGGGVVTMVNASLTIIYGSSVCNNTAGSDGGGVAIYGRAQVSINSSSKVCNNSCANGFGGGVAVADEAQLTVTGGSSVSNNTAAGNGGGVAIYGRAQVAINSTSKVCNNSCANGGGGGVAVADEAQLTVSGGSSVCYNRGSGGGGLWSEGNAQITITGASTVYNNTSEDWSGGGLSVADDARLDITGGSSVCSNWAASSAGGLFLAGNSTAKITDATICNNTCEGFERVGGAGLVVDANASVYICSTQVVGNWVNYSSGGAIVVAGYSNLTLGPGVVLADNSVNPGYVGTNIATYDRSVLYIDPNASVNGWPLTKCDRSIYLGRLPCQLQEGEYEASGICQCCPEHQYSFTAGVTSCQPCPDNAQCPGATRVLPNPGYYHSAERSVQMHACPIANACPGNDTCADGYTGSLCGSCAKGYGQTLPLRCGRCMPPAQQFGIYVLLVFVTVVLITLTVHFTWQDNKAGDKAVRPSDLCKVLAQFLQYLVILGSMSVRWPKFLIGMFAAATVVFGGASGQALSLDCWLENYVPQKHLPLAVQRQLALFVVTFGILLAVMLLMSCVHIFRRVTKVRRGQAFRWRVGQLWRKLRVAVLVVIFYAYPTLVKASLSFFACLRIDDKSKQPYPKYAVLNHTAGYWVQDIQQACFAGWHKPWALGFGIPARGGGTSVNFGHYAGL